MLFALAGMLRGLMNKLMALIAADFEVAFKRNSTFIWIFFGFFYHPGFRVALLYRIAKFFRSNGMRVLGFVFTRLIRISSPVDIETTVEIGPGILMPHPIGIVIGGNARIGRNCKIMQGVSIGGSMGKKNMSGQSQPYIGDNVFIGAGAKILGPVTVGDNAIIGANAVVIKDVPPGKRALGVPAEVS